MTIARIALFTLVLLKILQFSTCHLLKSSVTCLDCPPGYDLSGIEIVVKCNQVKNLAMATTNEHGTFETQLPSSNCEAKILGGPKQLYAPKRSMISNIMKAHDTDSYTTSQPLSFYTSCPLSQNHDGKCGTKNNAKANGRNIGSSKTIDLPLPKEWGLAPSSYYIPVLPIIGIP